MKVPCYDGKERTLKEICEMTGYDYEVAEKIIKRYMQEEGACLMSAITEVIPNTYINILGDLWIQHTEEK